jgi:6-pyruvoyltetrahydropterin/6-carboxytetrahydropterin synthase
MEDERRRPGSLVAAEIQYLELWRNFVSHSQESQIPMFRVTKEINFCYGHRLLNYSGKCRHLHGHNGKAVIVMERPELNELGMVVDFSEIKESIRTWIDENLDHRMILCERDPAVEHLRAANEPLYLLPVNPTAENIARTIYEFAKSAGFPVVEVSLWETPTAFATYRG